ncbi:MAG: sterol desaturase family protein [Candidatus Neomarinimicrobiota bacterium]
MSFFIQSLLVVIPIFTLLIIIEEIYSRTIGEKVNRSIDTISSLSSGITNITKDGMKFSIVLISYSFFLEHLKIITLQPPWASVLLAILVQDFSGYWLHRLNHRVNVFWNRHVIHHSSEEFNLSCALRQSISETIHFGALLMIPAALFGVPAKTFAILGPIHLFMQFWYHTKLINKMGWLENLIITPSHHRVHHAINPEYIDKNYGQIFIIWDKLFGTFQPELDNVKPVFGILRPVKTWNPIIINYKHLWQLVIDAYHTKSFWDKIRIWFMPTGWRPDDVAMYYPIISIKNPYKQKKYETETSYPFILWSFIQLNVSLILMFHFFTVIHLQSALWNFGYGFLIIFHVFSFTSALDRKSYSIITELIKMIVICGLLFKQGFIWFGLDMRYGQLLLVYSFISLSMTSYFHNKIKNKLTQ